MGQSGHFYSYLFICGPYVVTVVKFWDRWGYSTSTNIPWVDGLSTNPREMGRHIT